MNAHVNAPIRTTESVQSVRRMFPPLRTGPGDPITPSPDRVLAFDGIRGICAAIVVAQHLGVPIDAHWAVILFFVLSGRVLARPWLAGRPPAWRQFAVRRAFRLLPAALAAIAFAAAIAPRGWHHDATDCTLLWPQCSLDPPLWSLAWEIRVSLVLPALVPFIVTRPETALALALVGIQLPATLIDGAGVIARPDTVGLLSELACTGHYASLFAIGVVTARGPALPPWLLLPAWALLAVPSDLAQGVGAAAVICAVAKSGTLTDALSAPPAVWFGKVSFSLYLVHWPLIIAFPWPQAPAGAMAAGVACVIAAPLMYRFVEVPGTRLGRLLCGHTARNG